MGKKKVKPVGHSKKEEAQGKKVLVGLGVAALILAFLMFLVCQYLA